MAWLIIKDNRIDNQIAYDGVSPYTPPEGTLVQYEGQFDIGWGWSNNAPVPPEGWILNPDTNLWEPPPPPPKANT